MALKTCKDTPLARKNKQPLSDQECKHWMSLLAEMKLNAKHKSQNRTHQKQYEQM